MPMSDDWTKEIRDRMNAYIYWKKAAGESLDEIRDSHVTDIANLLKEREVLREALKRSWKCHQAGNFDAACEGAYICDEAMAWKPE